MPFRKKRAELHVQTVVPLEAKNAKQAWGPKEHTMKADEHFNEEICV